MFISRLVLDHFRSWDHCVVDFEPGVNILQGFNGLGKTNIIEAVEVLSTGSSHRSAHSAPLVERGQAAATIRANIRNQREAAFDTFDTVDTADTADTASIAAAADDTVTTYEATIYARGTNRARINSGRSLYMRDIVGQVPSVMFAPEDQWLVSGDPAQRRNFLDQTGALLIPGYAERLQHYGRIAKQRATLLRQLGQDGAADSDAALNGLEIWTGEFITTGVALTRDRQHLVDLLLPSFSRIYRTLAGDHNPQVAAGLIYRPSFDEILDFDDPAAEISRHFQRIYQGEVARGRNLIGPHRDDMDIELEGMPAREFASNGEMWTLALSLKMALLANLSQVAEQTPIVLLDDVFAQLDESRRRMILDFANGQGQVLITVAAASDIPDIPGARIIDVADLGTHEQDVNVSLVEKIHASRLGLHNSGPAADNEPTANGDPPHKPDEEEPATATLPSEALPSEGDQA